MAYTFNGVSQYLTTPTSPVSGVPLTLACWTKLNSLTGGPTIFNLQGADVLSASILLGIRPSDLTIRLFTSGVSTIQSAPAVTGQWFHAAGVVTSTTSRAVYYNGTSSGSSTTSVAAPTLTRVIIGADIYSGAPEAFVNGAIAECGVWSAALTAVEIASLAKGISPRVVRPQSLVFYAPLLRNLIDYKGRLTITNNNGATAADHARIYY